MSKYHEVLEICYKLSEYAELQNDSMGNANQSLSDLWEHTTHFTAEFTVALEAEIKLALKMYQKETKIKEVTEEHVMTYKTLEWINE